MNTSSITHPALSQSMEKALLAIAFLYSIIVTVYLWGIIAMHQPVWPLPALYFLELVLLPGIALLSAMHAWPRRMHLTAMAAGVTTSFAALSLFSIGLYYAPLALLLLIGAALSRHAAHQSLPALFGIFVLGAAAQALGILLLATA